MGNRDLQEIGTRVERAFCSSWPVQYFLWHGKSLIDISRKITTILHLQSEVNYLQSWKRMQWVLPLTIQNRLRWLLHNSPSVTKKIMNGLETVLPQISTRQSWTRRGWPRLPRGIITSLSKFQVQKDWLRHQFQELYAKKHWFRV